MADPPYPTTINLKPPYYAVIFTATRRPTPDDGYSATEARMEAMAREQPGFLAFEWVAMPSSAVDGEVRSMSVSYWVDEESLRAWKRVMEHREAQIRGREEWYWRFELRICKVERTYGFTREAKL